MWHRQSIRLRGFNYTSVGAYFVTVCTYQREHLFGKIKDGEICLNDFGTIVKRIWSELSSHFVGVELDEFIIMPNHIHGIIWIHDAIIVGAGSPRPVPGSTADRGRGDRAPTTTKIALGKILAYLKYQTTKNINVIRSTPFIPVWQRNYYERIIRDEDELNRIRQYIRDNPQHWDVDEENIPVAVA